MSTSSSSATGVFLIIATITSAVFGRIKDASYTCCYSKQCPLPVFKQWSGQKDILQHSNYIIYDKSCCPDSCKVYFDIGGYTLSDTKYGINSTQFLTGTLQTSCVCNCPQSCSAITDDTCDGSQSMTAAACPDAKVDDINLIPNSVTTTTQAPNQMDYKCSYDPGAGQRPMSQRCFPETICVDNGKTVDGSYTKMAAFYNGFVQYTNDLYRMRIEEEGDRLRWVFRLQSNDSKVTSMGLTFFDIRYTALATMGFHVYGGACTRSPTAEPSAPSAPPTNKPTAQPTSPTSDPTKRPTASPTPKPTAEPTPPTLSPTARPTAQPTPPTPRPTRPTWYPTVWRPPTPRPTSYLDYLFRPTTAPTKSPIGRAMEPTEPKSSDNTVLVVVIIILVLVVIVLGGTWWRNRKQAKGLNQYYGAELMNNQGAPVAIQPAQVQYVRM